jgi:hypothetical protein
MRVREPKGRTFNSSQKLIAVKTNVKGTGKTKRARKLPSITPYTLCDHALHVMQPQKVRRFVWGIQEIIIVVGY